jgi:hypothetical protein
VSFLLVIIFRKSDDSQDIGESDDVKTENKMKKVKFHSEEPEIEVKIELFVFIFVQCLNLILGRNSQPKKSFI